MRLPIESAHKTAGYLTLVPAYGRDYKSKREVMEAWDAGKDFIVQDMMSPYDGKPINKADAKAAGIGNVNIRYKKMRSVAVIKVAAGKAWVVPPDQFIESALREGIITPSEARSRRLRDAASIVAGNLRDRHLEGQGFGSSDFWYYLEDFLHYARIPFVRDSRGEFTRLPEGTDPRTVRRAKFPEGKKMTVDEVAEVVGPEFKQMNEDPPESVKKVRKEMEEAMSADLLPVERAASEQQAEKLEAEAEANEAQADADRQKADAARMKESAGGLYGYTKGTQTDVEATIRKAQRQASKLAKTLHGQDHQAMDFLRVHAKRSGSKTARLLLALMEEYPQVDLLPIEQVKQAEDTPMGMYGYPSGTARLALDACSALRSGIGEVAYNLHSRRMAKHDRITGFLKEHSKTAKCGYARLLLDTYPEAPRLAAKKKLPDELKKHQFTSDDNPNPKGNDKDGDGKSGEKPDFLKEIEDKKGKKASLRRAARRHFAGRRYNYDEVIDFLTEDKSTPELERMWKKWSEMVEDLHDRWFEGWAEANAPELLDESIDYKELAWKAFGSVTGMGIGLWEGDFLGDEHDEAFEKVVNRDSKVSRFGQDLDDEITMARLYDDEESMRMASRRKMLRKAFVPDSVDGWLEWEDGSRTAARKTAGRKVTIEAEDGGYIVYLHGIRRNTGLTPPVPLRQAEEIASIVRNYPKNYTAEQIGSELHRSFFSSRRA